MKYKLVIFDVDGTLMDTEATALGSLERTAQELLGRQISFEEAFYCYGRPSILAGEYLGAEDNEAFHKRWTELFIEMRYLIRPYPGCEEAVRKIKEAGMITGVVTSRNRFEMDYDDKFVGMRPYMDYIVTTEDTEKHKPHPEPALCCIERAEAACGMKFAKGEVLYLGDTPHDYHCAHDAGCDFALADWRLRGDQGLPVEYHFTNAAQMLDIVLQK